ncbi:MAG: phosphoribosylformylglycinamidine synthase subunit PurS [bacterium]|nr:phosphoribosylformylglycinamidine synthase subunit PurS [bacterium]
MIAKIHVTLKPAVLDPQGKAVLHALESLEFNEVQDVRIGRFIELKLKEADRSAAEKRVKEMCEKLLANTVIESYQYEIL